jgi:hypothetical protein
MRVLCMCVGVDTTRGCAHALWGELKGVPSVAPRQPTMVPLQPTNPVPPHAATHPSLNASPFPPKVAPSLSPCLSPSTQLPPFPNPPSFHACPSPSPPPLPNPPPFFPHTQTDLLEHSAVTDVVVPSVVLEEVKVRNASVYARLRSMISNEAKRFFVFANEHHR